MRQDAIEQFEIKPAKGLTEGVTLSEEKTNVEVLFFCKEHKECRLGALTLCLPLDFYNPLHHSPLRLIFLSNFYFFSVLFCTLVV